MDDTHKILQCPKCGQEMNAIAVQKANAPWDMVLEVVRSDFKFSALQIYECPKKHDGALIMRRNFGKAYRKRRQTKPYWEE